MTSISRVIELIHEQDPNANVSGIKEIGDRVFGEFKSALFHGMSSDERNSWVNKFIREPLGIEGYNVGILVPLEPGEEAW